MTEPLAHLDSELRDGGIVVHLSGEIDLSNAADLELDIHRAIANHDAVTIDLSRIEYMDSQGVRLLHRLAHRLEASAAALTVVAPADTVAGEILRLTRLCDLVDLRESLEG